MSQTITQPSEVELEKSSQVVWNEIHVPAFLEKLASQGTVPQNMQEAEDLLTLSVKLASAYPNVLQQLLADSSAPPRSKYAVAIDTLDAPYMQKAAGDPADRRWSLACELAQDPSIYGPASTLYDYQMNAG